jgi:alpha-L-arabinofuranosidase
MIFFDNKNICLTPNYHVQKCFLLIKGRLLDNVITHDPNDSTLAASCVQDRMTGDVILKFVNASNALKTTKVNLTGFKKINSTQTKLYSRFGRIGNTLENSEKILPVRSTVKVNSTFECVTQPTSLTVIRIKTAP